MFGGKGREEVPFLLVTFGTRKVLRKEKKTKKIDFLMFGFTVEKLIYNQNFSKIVCISKFLIPYIIEETNK